jgi:hypothetical protein
MHLQRAAANTTKVDPRLQMQWPPTGLPIWSVFKSLARQPSMGGIGAISQQEIQAWQSNHGIRLTPWELEVIEMFDGIVLSTHNQQDSK